VIDRLQQRQLCCSKQTRVRGWPLKAKFLYTSRPDPRGPARTLSETSTNQRSFSEIRVVRVRAGPRGSGRVRVVEFSYKLAAMVRGRRVGSKKHLLDI